MLNLGKMTVRFRSLKIQASPPYSYREERPGCLPFPAQYQMITAIITGYILLACLYGLPLSTGF